MQLPVAICVPLACVALTLALQPCTNRAHAQQPPPAQLSAPQASALLNELHERFVPTPSNFGRPLTRNFGGYTRKKTNILLCKPAVDDCIVKDMPLLRQQDSRLNAPLVTFLSGYAVGAPAVLPLTDKDGMTVLDKNGNLYTPSTFATAMLGNGCNQTSEATVIMTSLAYRASSVHLSGQTTTFNAIGSTREPVGEETSLPKDLRKLLWKYKNSFRLAWGAKLKLADKNVPYFSFPGVVADVSGGIQENCDPYGYGDCNNQAISGANNDGHALGVLAPSAAELTNDTVKAMMMDDQIVMLAYSRWVPTTSYNTITRTLTVTLTFASLHKVVVNGFQPGKFPLLINDVGDGYQHKVRLSSDLGSLKFAAPGRRGPSGGLTMVKYGFIDKEGHSVELQGRPFLAYEGSSEGVNPTVFFIDQYRYLHIKTGISAIVPQQIPMPQPGPGPILKMPQN
jgi:hypothetical protein